MFWDRAFNCLAMVPITLNLYRSLSQSELNFNSYLSINNDINYSIQLSVIPQMRAMTLHSCISYFPGIRTKPSFLTHFPDWRTTLPFLSRSSADVFGHYMHVWVRAVPFKSVGGRRNGRFFEGGRGRILN